MYIVKSIPKFIIDTDKVINKFAEKNKFITLK